MRTMHVRCAAAWRACRHTLRVTDVCTCAEPYAVSDSVAIPIPLHGSGLRHSVRGLLRPSVRVHMPREYVCGLGAWELQLVQQCIPVLPMRGWYCMWKEELGHGPVPKRSASVHTSIGDSSSPPDARA